MFYPFRDEKELLSGFSTLHQNKHGGQRVQVVANMNKIKFESYVDLVDQAFSQFNENLSQVAIIKLENDETPKAKRSNENDSEDK